MNRNVTERVVRPLNYIFEHGGSIMRDNVIDLSSNINPLGQPCIVKDVIENLTCIHMERFPDKSSIIDALSTIENLDREVLYPVPGASVGILMLLLYMRPRLCIVQNLTYVDYLKIPSMLDVKMIHVPTRVNEDRKLVPDLEKLKDEVYRNNSEDTLVIIVCPNNPTGHLLEYDKIREIAEIGNRCRILVDITFIDFVNMHNQYKKLIDQDNIIVIKSLSKIIATPGLRVGYIAGKIVNNIPALDWPLSTLAEQVLMRISEEVSEYRNFIEKTSRYIYNESRRVVVGLSNRVKKSKVFNTDSHMFMIESSEKLYSFLLHNFKIKIRKYCILENGNVLYRISLRRREENDLLLSALSEFEDHA